MTRTNVSASVIPLQPGDEETIHYDLTNQTAFDSKRRNRKVEFLGCQDFRLLDEYEAGPVLIDGVLCEIPFGSSEIEWHRLVFDVRVVSDCR